MEANSRVRYRSKLAVAAALIAAFLLLVVPAFPTFSGLLEGVQGGGPGTQTTGPTGQITVYAHRIPSPYWSPCFALNCSAGTGPGTSMYFVLYNSTGGLVQDGFANEAGFTFKGFVPGSTYFVYPEDCDLCHGSNHDIVFQYWGDNASTTRPIAASPGDSLDAWFSCTNSC
jgi:hypothetical protein